MRSRALFAVQIDSAWLHPVTATFEMTLQDGLRRQLSASVVVRPNSSVNSEIVGLVEPGERPIALTTRVNGEGLDFEVLSNLESGAGKWPVAVAGFAIPATSALVAWYFASQATRGLAPPERLALPPPPAPPKPPPAAAAPPDVIVAEAAADVAFAPPATLEQVPAPAPEARLPQVVTAPRDVPVEQTEPIRVGLERVGEDRISHRYAARAPEYPWPFNAISLVGVRTAVARTLGLMVTAGLTGVSAIAAIAYVHPQITELAMPAPVPRGSHVDVMYKMLGFGSGEYTLVDADGTTLDDGTLAAKDGVFRVDIPSHVTGHPVTLRLVMTGPFGDAHRELSADVLPVPGGAAGSRPAPHIEMLSVDQATVSGGDWLPVRYHVTPPVGAVMVIDATGAILASAPLTAAGHSSLHIPPTDRSRDVAVVLRATGGSGDAETRVPLQIVPATHAAATQPAPPQAVPAGNSDSSTSNEMALLTPRVSSGEPIRLHVPLPYDQLTISLSDPEHRVVAERNYAAAYDPVRIEAPAVSAPTVFELHASIQSGVAVNIGVFRVTVFPAAHAAAPVAQ